MLIWTLETHGPLITEQRISSVDKAEASRTIRYQSSLARTSFSQVRSQRKQTIWVAPESHNLIRFWIMESTALLDARSPSSEVY